MSSTVTTEIAKLLADLKADLKAVFETLLDGRLVDLKADLKAEFKTLLRPLEISQSVLAAKLANSAVGRDELLIQVPAANGRLPGQADPPIAFPASIMELMAEGDESLPNGQPNPWNASKSKQLLRHYGNDFDSDTENEQKARSRRLQVAKVIGITRAQLSYAQLML